MAADPASFSPGAGTQIVTPQASTVAPGNVVLLVDANQVRSMRNTFVFWEFVTLGLGIYIGKKVFEPAPPAGKVK